MENELIKITISGINSMGKSIITSLIIDTLQKNKIDISNYSVTINSDIIYINKINISKGKNLISKKYIKLRENTLLSEYKKLLED